jgi:hypothetical protein
LSLIVTYAAQSIGLLARNALAGFFEGITLATWFQIAGEFVCPNSVEILHWPSGTTGAKMPYVPVHFTAKFHYSTASSFYGRSSKSVMEEIENTVGAQGAA